MKLTLPLPSQTWSYAGLMDKILKLDFITNTITTDINSKLFTTRVSLIYDDMLYRKYYKVN